MWVQGIKDNRDRDENSVGEIEYATCLSLFEKWISNKNMDKDEYD